jgi:creatinine amidohydrolase
MREPDGQSLVRMSTATYPEIQRAVDRAAVLVLPVGSVEQHGPHLPLNTDSVIAARLACCIETDRPLVLAPTLDYAADSRPRTGGGRQFPGSVGLPGSLLAPVLSRVVSEFLRHGFGSILVLNGHMENGPAIFEALEENLGPGGRWAGAGRRAVHANWWDFVTADHLGDLLGTVSVDWGAEHAGILETSLMEALAPELVRAGRRAAGGSADPRPYDNFPARPETLWTNGIGTTALPASAEIGSAIVKLVGQELARMIDLEFPPAR